MDLFLEALVLIRILGARTIEKLCQLMYVYLPQTHALDHKGRGSCTTQKFNNLPSQHENTHLPFRWGREHQTEKKESSIILWLGYFPEDRKCWVWFKRNRPHQTKDFESKDSFPCGSCGLEGEFWADAATPKFYVIVP